MESGEIVSVLGALAQETRLEVFRQLVQAGPGGLSAGEIAKRLEIPAPTLSFHLRSLLHARLVSSERDGRSRKVAMPISTPARSPARAPEGTCHNIPTRS